VSGVILIIYMGGGFAAWFYLMTVLGEPTKEEGGGTTAFIALLVLMFMGPWSWLFIKFSADKLAWQRSVVRRGGDDIDGTTRQVPVDSRPSVHGS
jgi:hypothetical protein